MLFWALAGLLTAAAVALLVRPLLSPRIAAGAPHARARSFRGILEALARDEKAGLLAGADSDEARALIARALIADVEGVPAQREAAPQKDEARRRGLAALLAALVTLGALAAYLAAGRPDAVRTTLPESPPDLVRLVEALKQRLAERPDDAEGQRFLGRALSALGRNAEAAEAYERALKLGEDGAGAHADYGEALVRAQGRVSQEAEQAFARALARDKTEPRALFYLGLAKREAGDIEGALALWQSLLDQSPQDAPWRASLAREIAAARQALAAAQGGGMKE